MFAWQFSRLPVVLTRMIGCAAIVLALLPWLGGARTRGVHSVSQRQSEWNEPVLENPLTGSVYVFVEPSGGWVDGMTETQKLLAGDNAAGDEFGTSLFIDGTVIAIGVPYNDLDVGSTYIFDATPLPTLYIYLPFLHR